MIRYIYTFFLGLFLAIFVGMGIAVFYPEPKSPEPPAWYNNAGKYEPSAVEKQQEEQYNIQQKNYNQQLRHYNRNVSAIVLGCAVIILAISLLLAEKLGVLADGLLLGGIFTLLYGIGRGMATDSNKYRFAVAAVGLIATLALGYIKFIRQHLRSPRY